MPTSIRIGQLEVPAWKPVVIYTLTGRLSDELLEESGKAAESDLLEWRLDYYLEDDIQMLQDLEPSDQEEALAMLAAEVTHIARELLLTSGKELILSCRDGEGGGRSTFSPDQSLLFMKMLAERRAAAVMDLQYTWGGEALQELTDRCHEAGITVILSYRWEEPATEVDEMTELFSELCAAGADIPRIEIQTEVPQDTARLILAMRQYQNEEGRPAIAVAYGRKTSAYSLAAQRFGSKFCFAGNGKKEKLPTLEEIRCWHKETMPVSESPNVYLVGMSGSGKSTLARLCEELTFYKAVDADDELTHRLGLSPAELSQSRGTELYKEQEMLLYRETAGQTARIVSCGSAAVLEPENVLQMKRRGGKIVWLAASFATAAGRLDALAQADRSRLGKTADLQSEILEREDLYAAAADEIIFTDNRDVRSVCSEICAIIFGNR